MSKTSVIVAAIVECEGEYLVLKRSDNRRFESGLYEPVCGYVERFETVEDAALREVKEETGFDGEIVKRGKTFEINNQHGNWIIIPFLVKVINKNVKLSEEHSNFKWINPKDLNEREFVKGIKKDFESVDVL